MKRLALFAVLLSSAAMPALAQTAAAPATVPAATAPATPAPAVAPAPATVAAPEMTKDGKPTMKTVRIQCRDMVKASGERGDARRQALQDCIIKQRPDMEAKVKCQMDPSFKGLDKSAKHEAYKACVQKAKS